MNSVFALGLRCMELRMQEGCSAWGCAVEEGRVKEENAGEAGLDQMRLPSQGTPSKPSTMTTSSIAKQPRVEWGVCYR